MKATLSCCLAVLWWLLRNGDLFALGTGMGSGHAWWHALAADAFRFRSSLLVSEATVWLLALCAALQVCAPRGMWREVGQLGWGWEGVQGLGFRGTGAV